MALGAAMTLHPEVTLNLTLFKLVTDVLGGMSATLGIKVEARKKFRSHAKMDEIDNTSLEQVAVRLSKASLAGAKLISCEIAEGSAVLAEFFAGRIS